jgi:DNA end-binding protein Ku
VTKEELEEVALESTRTIEIDEFVERDEIDPLCVPKTLSALIT